MGDTKIEWADKTWNPTRGCSRVSEGCRNCFAERVAGRFSGPGGTYEGLVTVRSRHPQTGRATVGVRPKWTGEVRLVPERLADPLRWRKPRRIFVNSMSDLFHEKLSDEAIAAVFGVMVAAPWHTFIVLTKRPERMRSFFLQGDPTLTFIAAARRAGVALPMISILPTAVGAWNNRFSYPPLPNVVLGVSVEDQATADERIPLLLDTPAAVRLVSYEPALGPVDFTLHGSRIAGWDEDWKYDTLAGREWASPRTSAEDDLIAGHDNQTPRINWVICGAESGPYARTPNIDWFRSVAEQCRAAHVPVFMKQLRIGRQLCKDLDSFPPDLQVREWPR